MPAPYKYGILLTEYVLGETTIGGPYYALIIERLCWAILEIRSGKVVLVFHVNASIHKCNIVQAAIRKAGFVELNDRAYSLDIASCDCYLLSNLNKFLRGKDFSCDDETIDTVENYLNKID